MELTFYKWELSVFLNITYWDGCLLSHWMVWKAVYWRGKKGSKVNIKALPATFLKGVCCKYLHFCNEWQSLVWDFKKLLLDTKTILFFIYKHSLWNTYNRVLCHWTLAIKKVGRLFAVFNSKTQGAAFAVIKSVTAVQRTQGVTCLKQENIAKSLKNFIILYQH